jgi:hypothetical protein
LIEERGASLKKSAQKTFAPGGVWTGLPLIGTVGAD